MIITPASQKRHYVTLDKPLPEDSVVPVEPKTLNPVALWVAIEPTAPGAFDEQKISHVVRCSYHPHITLNTRLTLVDGRQLWVRGLQDVEMRHIELVLLCEEVLTP